MRVGFFINPRAGYGALVGRKGSDSVEDVKGEMSVSVTRGLKFLSEVKDLAIDYLVPSGIMGADEMDDLGIRSYGIIYQPGNPSTSVDTRCFMDRVAEKDPDLVVFCGGDGTARDILSSGHSDIPVLGVPSGVKMESSVFAASVQFAVNVMRNILSAGTFETVKAEIVDIPEEEIGDLHPSPRLYGELRTPISEGIINSPKMDFFGGDVEGIVDYFLEHLDKNVRYILGPGSTCKAIIRRLGKETSLLGFDLVFDGNVEEQDITEERIYEVVCEGSCMLVISPVGGQNFLLGRGNKQISGRIVTRLGFSNIIVISAEEKLTYTKKLYIDLDNISSILVPKYVRVLTGYGMFKIVKIEG
ncbi:MAG: ATP-NAD kinase family protein [Thermoplasmataceae archaeon]